MAPPSSQQVPIRPQSLAHEANYQVYSTSRKNILVSVQALQTRACYH